MNGAKYFIPDADGFYPIDYAGMFSHEDLVKLLINHHLSEINKSKPSYKNIMGAPPKFGSLVKEVLENLEKFNSSEINAKREAKIMVSPEEKENIEYERKGDFWK